MSDQAREHATVDDQIPTGTMADLLQILDLKEGEDEDEFVGPSQPQPWHRVYGGQVLAQSLVAAQRTVDPTGDTRPVHSMHAYFLRAGDDSEPITFSVERLRDGSSFTARRVHALQFGRPILSMAASFQTAAEGVDHAIAMPQGLPRPEDVPSLAERYPNLSTEASRRWLRQRPMDLRHVTTPSYIEASSERIPELQVWMRAVEPVPAQVDTPALHAAILAYASDYSMLEPVLRRHGLYFGLPGIKIASLDHAMWFHRPARADEWLLTVLDSPSAQGARGLGTGRLYTQDGVMVASTAQEGMIRLPR